MKVLTKIKGFIPYVLIVAVPFFFFFFVVQIAFVEGDSMNDTYEDGDMLFCLRLGEPKKGDVIVTDSDRGKILVKRVIATEGDTIYIDFEAGEVFVNDVLLEEDYIKEPTYTKEGTAEYPFTVPEGCYYVMGDNRNHSEDSRSDSIGFIHEEQIQGKVLFEL